MHPARLDCLSTELMFKISWIYICDKLGRDAVGVDSSRLWRERIPESLDSFEIVQETVGMYRNLHGINIY